MSIDVFPKKLSIPLLNWSLFECWSFSLTADGLLQESIAVNEMAGDSPGQDVISPDLRKLKKAVQDAAQSRL